MSADRISAAKRKASDVDLDSEDVVFFPHKLKPIVTARPACNQRILKLKAGKPSETESAVDSVLPTEQVNVDVAVVKLISPTIDSNNLSDGNDGCETPKSEEHRIPKILTCPPAPRKPRPTARRRTQSAAKVRRALFVNPSDLDLLFAQKRKKF